MFRPEFEDAPRLEDGLLGEAFQSGKNAAIDLRQYLVQVNCVRNLFDIALTRSLGELRLHTEVSLDVVDFETYD